MSTKIFEFNVFNKSKNELLNELFLREGKTHIISGNPEVLTNAMQNEILFSNFTSEESMIIPDGIGVVISSKIVKQPVKEKIAGIEVMEDILKYCEKNSKKVYLLGSEQQVLIKCSENIQKKYRKLEICGKHNGFFDLNNCQHIIEDINQQKPYVIFVAMGSPRQELFISKYMNKIDASIFMGVGGSFDIYAEKLKRAPKWMIKLGLEWLYRVYKEPFRIKRLDVIPKFILKVFVNKYIIKKDNRRK